MSKIVLVLHIYCINQMEALELELILDKNQ